MKEREIQRDIVKFLRHVVECSVWETSQGFRRDPGGTRMTPGIPDLFVMHQTGVWTWVEVKAERGKLSEAQECFREECLHAGVHWRCWRDVREAWDWAVEVGLVEEAA
jgi:hypothetical protein